MSRLTLARAILLHYGGGEVFDILKILDFTARVLTPATAIAAAVVETDCEASIRSVQEYFIPRQNIDFEILVFRQVA